MILSPHYDLNVIDSIRYAQAYSQQKVPSPLFALSINLLHLQLKTVH